MRTATEAFHVDAFRLTSILNTDHFICETANNDYVICGCRLYIFVFNFSRLESRSVIQPTTIL